MLKTSPFHSRTAPLVRAQTWRRWAGYQMASAYDPHPEREYAAIRNAAALIDVSPLYKYRITGRDAARLLDRMVTRDVAKCRVGQVLYTPWCDAHGKVIDDGTISRLDEGTWRLTSADSSLRWLQMNATGMEVKIEDISEATGALSLQGPLSRAVLQLVSPADLVALKYFRLVHTTIREIPVTVSRTGYTGDLGYEIWVDAPQAPALWDALVAAGTPYGIVPTGVWALDIARIEAGLIMLDVDYFSAHHVLIEDQKSTPYEINLAWTVSATKGPFNGRRALAQERAHGSGVELRRHRRRVGIARATVRRAPSATPHTDRGVAHQRAGLSRGRAGRLRHQRVLVAAAQAARWRSRTCALRTSRPAPGSRSRSRSSTAARRPTRWCASFHSSIRSGRSREHRPALRRDRHRRRTQRARDRRVSRARRTPARWCSSAAPCSAARP